MLDFISSFKEPSLKKKEKKKLPIMCLLFPFKSKVSSSYNSELNKEADN